MRELFCGRISTWWIAGPFIHAIPGARFGVGEAVGIQMSTMIPQLYNDYWYWLSTT